jgi:outer membrane protein insertion porin family
MRRVIHILITLLLLSGCNSLRYVPEDKMLLDEYELNWNSVDLGKTEKRIIMSELEDAISPDPNGKFLGMRPGLWARYRTEQEKGKWITRYINKRYGERPVYTDAISPERIRAVLGNRLENNGFFFFDIDFNWKRSGKKTMRLVIDVNTSKPYRMENYTLDAVKENGELRAELNNVLEGSILNKDQVFQLETLKKERTRIQDALREKGFYYFHADHIMFEMDTANTTGERRFNLYLRLKPETGEKAKVPYTIRKVKVYTNYSERDSASTPVTFKDIEFDREDFFYPHLLRNLVLLEPGQTYNLTRQRKTSRYFNSLRTYAYANLRFTPQDTVSGVLDLSIYLTPAPRRSFSAELQALTRSNNFAGPAMKLTYSNRNIFRGGEILRLSTKFSFETQLGDGFDGGYSYEFGVRGEVDIPRLLFRSTGWKYSGYNLPRTRISTGVNFLRRAGFYTLNTFSLRYGYLWQSSSRVTHDIEVLDVTYSNLLNTTSTFENILNANPFLRRSFERQFIPAISYTYTYSQMDERNRQFRWFLLLHAESSGSLLGGSLAAFDADPVILGLPFAQYLKLETDIRLNTRVGKDRNLVGRIFTGYGYSYGNSTSLPFVKQYFAGGPNSVRAFRIRSLGPGGYVNPDPTRIGSFFDQSGDIRLEANVEYRFPLSSIFKGAWFLDAGNVWLLRDNPALPNGAISTDWYTQLAIGTGFGLRIDLNFFVLRFDIATPIRLHASEEDVWAIRNFNPGNRSWYKDGLMVNFALGYPF